MGRVSTSEHPPEFSEDNMQAAVNGTDERLDAILAELRAIRARIEAGNPQPVEAVELKEPAKMPMKRAR